MKFLFKLLIIIVSYFSFSAVALSHQKQLISFEANIIAIDSVVIRKPIIFSTGMFGVYLGRFFDLKQSNNSDSDLLLGNEIIHDAFRYSQGKKFGSKLGFVYILQVNKESIISNDKLQANLINIENKINSGLILIVHNTEKPFLVSDVVRVDVYKNSLVLSKVNL